jgi:hypothetical protein
MILAIKHRASYYKRFELDIWGILRTSIFKFKAKEDKDRRRVTAKPKNRLWRSSNVSRSSRKYFFRRINYASKRARMRLISYKNAFAKKNIFRTSKRKTKKLAYLRSHFLLTFFNSKLINIFDFFYKSFLAKQEYKRRARRRYIYRIDIIQRRVFKKKMKKRFVSLRLVKLFYLTLHYHQFRQLAQRTRRLAGCFEHNFFLALEGRLVSFVYRTSFIPNPFQCIEIVKRGNVTIEGVVQGHINYLIQLNQLVSFIPSFKRLIYLSLLYRLARGAILFNPPRYIYVSFIFLFTYMTRPPHRRDLVFPISLDMYRATGYAF